MFLKMVVIGFNMRYQGRFWIGQLRKLETKASLCTVIKMRWLVALAEPLVAMVREELKCVKRQPL